MLYIYLGKKVAGRMIIKGRVPVKMPWQAVGCQPLVWDKKYRSQIWRFCKGLNQTRPKLPDNLKTTIDFASNPLLTRLENVYQMSWKIHRMSWNFVLKVVW